MFEDVIEFTKEIQQTASSTKEFLATFRGARRRLVNKIAKAEGEIKSLRNTTKYIANLKTELTKAALKDAKNIIQGNLVQALRENYEFDTPTYKKAILEAVRDTKAYRITFRGQGWKIKPTVYIDLNRTAGRLQLWAHGVKLARQDFGTKVPRKGSKLREKSARQASIAWARIFERRGESPKFRETIKSRLIYSGQLAPFWMLLEYGEVPMASDRGGFPTPKKKATHFVEDTRTTLVKRLETTIANKETEYNNLFVDYDAFIKEANVRTAEMDKLIDEIKLDIQVINRVKTKLGPISAFIDSSKLENAVQLIRKGLLNKRTVELTARGSGKRVRVSTETITRYLYED